MATRNVHVVRCKDPNDKDTYADVKVYDQIGYLGPNGQVMLIDTNAKKAKPRVIDKTGDKNGIDEGSPSRISHMERWSNKEDKDQKLDLEILDTLAFTSPNGKRGVLHMPSNQATRTVKDTAGLGVASPGGPASRRCHTEKVTNKASDTAKQDEDTDFTGILVTDAVAWRHENGERSVLFLPNITEHDTTEYTADDNGDMNVPPDNRDPNPYVKFPLKEDGTTDTTGPWLGATPNNAQTGFSETPDQGLLWKITNMAGKDGPWCFCEPETQWYEWSLYGQNLCVGAPHFEQRCFPYCDEPCSCGCEEFLTLIYGSGACNNTWKRWPTIGSFGWIPCSGVIPHMGDVMPKEGYKTLDDAAWAAQPSSPNFNPDAIVRIKMKIEPQSRFTIPDGYSGWVPNVWQMVGMADQQPYHLNPDTGDKVWDMPGKKLAKEVAKKFGQMWNDTSDAYNNAEIAMDGCGDSACCEWRDGEGHPFHVAIGPQYPSEVADWKFGCPIVDGPTMAPQVLGNPFYPSNAYDFCAGLPPAGWWGGHTIYTCGDRGYTLWAFHPATAKKINVGQLDKKRWTWPANLPDGSESDDPPTPTKDNTGPLPPAGGGP